METPREYEQRTRVEFWLRRATDLEQKLARVTADRDQLAFDLGELNKRERFSLRQLREGNEQLQRERDEARAALNALRPSHETPAADEDHQGGNCADIVVSLVGRAMRAEAERDEARAELSRAEGLAQMAERRHSELHEHFDDLYADHESFVGDVAGLLGVPAAVVPAGEDPEEHPGVFNTEGVTAAVGALVARAEKAEEKVRILRPENDRLRLSWREDTQRLVRERDEALARAEKAEREVKKQQWERGTALDEMVRAGEDGGLYDLPEDARAERWCNCGATGTWHPWGDTPHCAMAAEPHAQPAPADRSEAPDGR